MRNCFVPGCDLLYKDMPKRKMFAAPKDKERFEAWTAVLPKVRVFKSHDKICERHFNNDDICTTYDSTINGQIYQIERGRPRLKNGAIPCRNLEPVKNVRRSNLPVRLDHNSDISSEPKHENTVIVQQTNSKNKDNCESVQQADVNIEVIDHCQAPDSLVNDGGTNGRLESIEILEVNVLEVFESLYDDIYEVLLPSTLWGIHRCPERTAIFFSYVDPKIFRTTKMVIINSEGHIKVFLANRILNEQMLVLDNNVVESLSELLSNVDEIKLCQKASENELCEVTLKRDQSICGTCAALTIAKKH